MKSIYTEVETITFLIKRIKRQLDYFKNKENEYLNKLESKILSKEERKRNTNKIKYCETTNRNF
jgi:hypothetical protein